MDIFSLLLYFAVTVPSAIFHEYMHGWVADQLGDSTARYAGRLTLNPRSHVDLFGTILLPILLFLGSGGGFLFAYAKPVPYNPYNLKNQRWGPLAVGFAGPLANGVLAVTFALFLRFLPLSSFMEQFFQVIVLTNLGLMVFNLVPIPPLDGSKILYLLLWRRCLILIRAIFQS
jgi:Zn-dependent protease